MLELLYPRKCCVCSDVLERGQEHICKSCMEDFPYTYFWNWRDHPWEKALWGRCNFRFVCSLFYYSRDNDYSRLDKRIKYAGDISLGRWLGAMLGEKMMTLCEDVDYIVPVPVHPIRRWKRGYNQAEIIAKGIEKGLCRSSILYNALYRRKNSVSQTSLDVNDKWNNVKGVFGLKRGACDVLAGKHVLIVDDLLTTGATAQACFEALAQVPGIIVSFATLAAVRR